MVVVLQIAIEYFGHAFFGAHLDYLILECEGVFYFDVAGFFGQYANAIAVGILPPRLAKVVGPVACWIGRRHVAEAAMLRVVSQAANVRIDVLFEIVRFGIEPMRYVLAG